MSEYHDKIQKIFSVPNDYRQSMFNVSADDLVRINQSPLRTLFPEYNTSVTNNPNLRYGTRSIPSINLAYMDALNKFGINTPEDYYNLKDQYLTSISKAESAQQGILQANKAGGLKPGMQGYVSPNSARLVDSPFRQLKGILDQITSSGQNQVDQYKKLWSEAEQKAAAVDGGHSGFLSDLLKYGVPLALAAGGLYFGAPALLGGVGGTAAGTTAAAAPTLGSFATNSALLGAATGGAGGLLSGGGLSGALKGAAIGGLAGGFAPGVSGSLGFTGPAASAVSKGLTSAATSLGTGGSIKDALTSGLVSGGTSYAVNGLMGTPAGTPMSGGASGPTQGSGLLGAATRASPALSSAVNAISTMGGGEGAGSYIKPAIGAYGAYNSYEASQKAADAMMEQQRNIEKELKQYNSAGALANQQLSQRLTAGYKDNTLQNPAYREALARASESLNSGLAAQGLGQSGYAIKQAQNVGQGLANQYYNQGYQDWLKQNQDLAAQAGLGQDAAGSTVGVMSNMGNIKANEFISKNKILSQLLAGKGYT